MENRGKTQKNPDRKNIDQQRQLVSDTEITTELEKSYIDYAMSVIVARALPDVRDGLKPVHRRILWAMWDSGLTHSSKYRKSANVVGEVLGKYHPHGDASVYDSMVRMAQGFSLRYPLIDGQGNWGSVDGDNAAAMRYTECRLSKIAEEMLVDIEKNTVDFIPNYDASKNEPRLLPSKIPQFLLNGNTGIAVGMATDIPPHNLTEVSDALLHLIEKPGATSQEIMQFIQGPDFPTGGFMYDRKNIIEAYMTGQGAITCRAKADIVERKPGQFNIVISEIPYRVNKSELVQKIAQLVTEKKVEGIKDLRDESDKDGLLVTIELKNDATPQKVLNKLFKLTELQKDFHLNMIGLVNGIQPQLLSIKDVLEQYLAHRQVIVRRRTEFDLGKAKERAHILEGLVTALDQIDAVIGIIKKSKDRADAHENLIKKFSLTDAQTTAILEMKLQTLASLERRKIEEELREKMLLIKDLEIILSSPKKILDVIRKELLHIRETFGDARRTKLVDSKIGEFSEEDLVSDEDVIITLSASGYIKRVNSDVFKVQGRGGKGLIGSDVGDDDFLTHILSANTHDNILFFTDLGKVFQTKVYDVPQGSRTAKGKIIQNFLDMPPSENIKAIVAYSSKKNPIEYLIMATQGGVIKKTPLKDFGNVRRTGIIALKVRKGDELCWVKTSTGKDDILLITSHGQSIRFAESQLRSMGRGAAGVKGITLKKGDVVVGIDIANSAGKEKLLVVMEKGFAKQTSLNEYKVQSRGGQGIKTAKITPKTGNVVAFKILNNEENLIVLSAKGQIIKTDVSTVRESGRATSGVRVMRLDDKDKIVAITCI